MNYIVTTILGGVLALSGLLFGLGHQPPQHLTPQMAKEMQTYLQNSADAPVFGATQPAATQTYNLAGSGISPSATSITLTSLTIKQTGQPIQDSDLSDTFYITIEPGSNTKQEIIGCTTVGTNTGSTVTLSGCSRGLAPIYPYTASTTLAFTHAGGSQVIFSDPPQLFNQYAALANTQTITGPWTFSTLPTFTNAPAATTDGVNKAYADALAIQGAATSTFANLGLVRLGSSVQLASSTASSTSGAPLVTLTKYGTTTPGLLCNSGIWNCFPVAQVSGKISQLWLDLTQSFLFSGGIISTASSTFSSSLDVGSLTIGSKTVNNGFGGTGADGALSCSSGTTTIALGAASVVVKNYTSISITGTCYVQITGAASGGSVTLLKSQGNVTLTSSAVPMLDATSTGATAGAGSSACSNNTQNGSPGTAAAAFSWLTNVGGTSNSGGSAGTDSPIPTSAVYPNLTNVDLTPYPDVFVGSGGAGGGCGSSNPGASQGARGGAGAGALIIEVGGALNFTTTNGISVAGSKGSAGITTSGANEVGEGGAGGGAGYFKMLYNTLTANTGSVNISAGTQGTTVTNGSPSVGAPGAGGNPLTGAGTGYSLIGKNPR